MDTINIINAISLNISGKGFPAEFGESIAEQISEGKRLSHKQIDLLARLKSELLLAVSLPRASANAEHVGTVGKRVKGIQATVVFSRSFSSAWGVNTMMKFVDLSGNVFTTFTSGAVSNFNVGEKVTFDGTVKEHSEYQGTKETKLTRIAVA